MIQILSRSLAAFAMLSASIGGVPSTAAEESEKPSARAAADTESIPDTRPMNSKLVEHGSFSAKDISVNRLQWMTPAGKYRLDLKDIEVVAGATHRYKISCLPPKLILHLCFLVPSKNPLILEETGLSRRGTAVEMKLPVNELQQFSGIRRMHIHLATTEGLVLLSNEFNSKDSFQYTLPNYGRYPKGFTGFVSEGSRDGWTRGANTASGAAFVAKDDTSYILEITIVEVDEKSEKRQPLRPLIQS